MRCSPQHQYRWLAARRYDGNDAVQKIFVARTSAGLSGQKVQTGLLPRVA